MCLGEPPQKALNSPRGRDCSPNPPGTPWDTPTLPSSAAAMDQQIQGDGGEGTGTSRRELRSAFLDVAPCKEPGASRRCLKCWKCRKGWLCPAAVPRDYLPGDKGWDVPVECSPGRWRLGCACGMLQPRLSHGPERGRSALGWLGRICPAGAGAASARGRGTDWDRLGHTGMDWDTLGCTGTGLSCEEKEAGAADRHKAWSWHS